MKTGIRLHTRYLAVVLLSAVLSGPVLGQTPEELFDRGNLAYENGMFAEAFEAYRSASRYGIEDARLEYNLGNAAFRLGKIGEAILHYERAYRLDPVDPDITANLHLLRELRLDRIEPPEIAPPARLLRALQDRLGPDRQAMVLLVLVWSIFLLVAWFTRRPGCWRAAAGWMLAAMLCASLLIGASFWVTNKRLETSEMVVVLVDSTDVLAGPGENNAPLVTIHEGLTLEVRSEREDWVQVKLPDGLNGWVPRKALGFV